MVQMLFFSLLWTALFLIGVLSAAPLLFVLHSHCDLSLSLFLPIPSLAPCSDNLIMGPTRPWAPLLFHQAVTLRGEMQIFKGSVSLFVSLSLLSFFKPRPTWQTS